MSKLPQSMTWHATNPVTTMASSDGQHALGERLQTHVSAYKAALHHSTLQRDATMTFSLRICYLHLLCVRIIANSPKSLLTYSHRYNLVASDVHLAPARHGDTHLHSCSSGAARQSRIRPSSQVAPPLCSRYFNRNDRCQSSFSHQLAPLSEAQHHGVLDALCHECWHANIHPPEVSSCTCRHSRQPSRSQYGCLRQDRYMA